MTKKTEKNSGNSGDRFAWKLVTGLLLCALGLFMSVSFFSYLFALNMKTGVVGAMTAKSVAKIFGLGALLLPVIIFVIGVQILRPYRKFARTVVILAGAMVFLSIIPSFLMFNVKFEKFGGNIGGILSGSLVGLSLKTIGSFGTLLLILILLTAYGLYITPQTQTALKFLWQKILQTAENTYKKIRTEIKNVDSKISEKKEAGKSDILANNDMNIDEPEEEDYDGEEEDYDEDSEDDSDGKSPDIPSYNVEPEFESNVIEEEYLPEEMLTGELYDPTKDLSGYRRPPVDLLKEYEVQSDRTDTSELTRNKDKIVEILGQFKIQVDRITATVGPTVTLYEIIPKEGIRIAQIRRLEDDIALRIAARGVRIIAPIPGKGTVGIEVPNEKPDIVSMRSIIKSAKFQESKFDLPIALGKTILGEVFAFDLAKMPHLLVAGATGQGKSVGLNAILTSLLYKKHPAEIKIVMVDPKKVELAPYNKIEKHFLAKLPDTEEPIITDTQKVIYTLKSLCLEMDNRYDLLKAAGVRNVKEYNEKFVQRHLNPLKGHRYLPYILLVIDEFADLIMTAGKEIEEPIARLAQLARAIGIHLVIATQRPTTNIITGLIKANFPARIAFRVTSMIDSRTILDTPGANQLIGRGDMLVSTGADLIRVQCALVETPEIDKLTDFISTQPGYGAAYDLPEYADEKSAEKLIDMKNLDEMFDDAARLIVQNQSGSTSLIQRKLSLGYARSGRIMDQLEAAGIVGPASTQGGKTRQVLITDLISLENILQKYRKT
ncbi:MAG: DNA translocase FtsK [Prevotellaceae bacterium]|jgi:S-DNA-T family DNA segregation ATPase FtsK/SpoIIIE|nr:DNA translocase FtsK [Prevotellaceae bacterium]